MERGCDTWRKRVSPACIDTQHHSPAVFDCVPNGQMAIGRRHPLHLFCLRHLLQALNQYKHGQQIRIVSRRFKTRISCFCEIIPGRAKSRTGGWFQSTPTLLLNNKNEDLSLMVPTAPVAA
jgi:hypothetical protein